MSPRRLERATAGRTLRGLLSLLLAAALVCVADPSAAGAQYFGQNQVDWEQFDFRVLETETFDVYHYEEEERAAVMAGRMIERWSARQSRLLDYRFGSRQPFILYANHSDFAQTNAVPGPIGEATGGLTTPLLRRIIMPMAGPLADSDHVIGHELVHAYQFAISGISPDAPLFGAGGALADLPGWMIEGMAEYLSVGPSSTATAMRLRDVLADTARDLPTVRDLSNPREYFPYRWGHALWAYLAGIYGEDVVRETFRSAARTGKPLAALREATGVPVDTLSRRWKTIIRETYRPVVETTSPPGDFGTRIVGGDDSGPVNVNVGPALSPDGSRMVFLSQRGLFSFDMYLADAESGRVIRKLTETALDPHFQSLLFLNSAGSFAPDGRRFAFAATSKGEPVLAVLDVTTGERVREIRLSSLGEVYNPAWSPDGGRIAFSANVGGLLDLYVLELETRELTRLTDDPASELHPAWSPDGERIAFATDRFTSDFSRLDFGPHRLATVDPGTKEVEPLASFPGARNTNPRWGPEGESVYFLSDRGGIANLYRAELGTNQVQQLTNVTTGVTGITDMSPAISVARRSGRVVFTGYRSGGYDLYRMDPEGADETASRLVDYGRSAAALPPVGDDSRVAAMLADAGTGLPDPEGFTWRDYGADLNLAYVAPPSLGFTFGSAGSFVGLGGAALFSDMLGYHEVMTQLQLSIVDGHVLDGLGAQVQYVDREGRLDWGFRAGQAPQIFQVVDRFGVDTDDDGRAEQVVSDRIRFWQIDRRAMPLLQYPFSTVQRLELSAGFDQTAFESEVDRQVFDLETGRRVRQETIEPPACGDSIAFERSFRGISRCEPATLTQGVASAALVFDNALSAGTGPIRGQRYRLEASPALGTLSYLTALGDYRRYVRPMSSVTLAGRLFHFGRYGGDAGDPRLGQLFVGYPSLVRGYDSQSFSVENCPRGITDLSECPEVRVFENMFGSRLAAAKAELRLDLFGYQGLLGRGILPADLVAFYDAGVAWTADEEPVFLDGEREILDSVGVGLRANLLGFTMVEADWVRPLDRDAKGSFFQIHFTPAF